MVLGFLLIFLVYYKFYRHKFPVHLVSYDAAKKFTPRTLESLNDQISRRAVNNYQVSTKNQCTKKLFKIRDLYRLFKKKN